MDSSIISLVIFGVMVIGAGIFYFVSKQGGKNDEKSSTKNKSASSSTNNSDIKKEDIFKFMEFDKIQDDMIVQNKGTKYTMAIKCKGINYELMSEVEQMAVEEGFITFLNTLKYPIQLYVQAQNIDLKGAINMYKQNISGIKEEFEEADSEYQTVTETFEATQLEIDEVAKKRDRVLNVYEYANDIISYVEKMSSNKSLLQRNFYVLISYYTSEINATEKFSKDELVNICYTELFTRAQGVISALASSSVEGKILNSNELADLLYNAYNRDDRGLMGVKEALESGFYRLYSTSKDAFQKRQEIIEEQIENQAKVKAYQAIVDSINDGSYVSPQIEALKIDEQSSRLANEIIKRENIPNEIKEVAQEKVIENYRENKKQAVEQATKEKEELLKVAKEQLGINVDKVINENESKGQTTDNNQGLERIEPVINNQNQNILRDENKKVNIESSENDSII